MKKIFLYSVLMKDGGMNHRKVSDKRIPQNFSHFRLIWFFMFY